MSINIVFTEKEFEEIEARILKMQTQILNISNEFNAKNYTSIAYDIDRLQISLSKLNKHFITGISNYFNSLDKKC